MRLLSAGFLVAALAAAASAAPVPSGVMVDGLGSPAVIARVPSVIQAVPPFMGPKAQLVSATRATVRDARSLAVLWTGTRNGSAASVPYPPAPALPPALPVLVSVAMLIGPADGSAPPVWSGESAGAEFATGLNQTDMEAVSGAAAAPAAALTSAAAAAAAASPAHLTFLRAECRLADLVPPGADPASVAVYRATAFVTGAAMPTADPGQILSTSAMSVAGRWLGYGPGRGDDGWGLAASSPLPPWHTPWRAHPVDWHNVTDDLRALGDPASPAAALAVGVWGFGGPLFAQLRIRWSFASNGSSAGETVLGTRSGSSGPCQWLAADGDPYLNPTWEKPFASPFRQPRERPAPALWPHGFDRPGFVPSPLLPWSAPSAVGLAEAFGGASGSIVVQTKRTRPVVLYGLGGGTGPAARPASITRLAAGRYFVDAGRNLMGGLNVTVRAPAAAAAAGAKTVVVRLRLSEEVSAPGQILFPMRTGNYYETAAEVRADGGLASVFNLEYSVFRYAQIDLDWLEAPSSGAVVSLWPGQGPAAARTCGDLGRACPAGATQEAAALEVRCAEGSRVSSVLAASASRSEGGVTGRTRDGAASAALQRRAIVACGGRRSCALPVRDALRAAGAALLAGSGTAVEAELRVECAPRGSGLTGATTRLRQPAQDPLVEVGVWTVQAPWSGGDGGFASSDPSLDAVVELARYTLQATTADTFTDSNTRERRPYEADGLITARGRFAWQREWAVQRHSLAYVLANPTWPTEWRQATPLMAEDVAEASGEASLAAAFDPLLDTNTMRGYVWPETGLVNWTTAAGPRPTRDIVDWPKGDRDGFVFTSVNSVVNSYAAVSLGALARLRARNGNGTGAASASAASLGVISGMRAHLWDEAAGTFCDGPCSVTSHSAAHSSFFPLWAGVAPGGGAWPGAASRLAARAAGSGWSNVSVYGAWAWLGAIAGPHGAGTEAAANGAAAIGAVRQPCGGGAEPDAPGTNGHCWRHMLASGATMTMEAFTREEKDNLSWSHPWAAAAAELALRFILGIRADSTGAASLRIAPALGALEWARGSVTMPRGVVVVSASLRPPPGPGAAALWQANVTVPPATGATVCAPLWWPAPPPAGSGPPPLPDLAVRVATLGPGGTATTIRGTADAAAGVVCTPPLYRPGDSGDGAVLAISRELSSLASGAGGAHAPWQSAQE